MTKGKGMFLFTQWKSASLYRYAAMLQFALELCYFVYVVLRFNDRCERLLYVASFGGNRLRLLVVPVEANKAVAMRSESAGGRKEKCQEDKRTRGQKRTDREE